MTTRAAPQADPEAWRARPWRLLRTSVHYMLDLVEIERDGGNVLDPLVIAVVSAASVSGVTQDARLEQAFATLDAPPPDEVRRPIAVNAIAASLGLPYESVRRCVHRLARQGEVRITPAGVIQPAAVATSPAHIRRSLAHYDRTLRLYEDLRDAGLAPLGCTALAGPFDQAPVRVVNRLRGEYALRVMMRAMALTGSPLRSFVLFAVARSNGAHLEPDVRDDQAAAAGVAFRPARIGELARGLKLPRETVRRHLVALEEAGFLSREDEGFLLRPAGVAARAGRGAGRGMIADFRRFIERLEQFGVIDWWEAERAGGAGLPPMAQAALP